MTVSGTLNYPAFEDTTAPEYAWVVATAYDSNSNVVGVRRWQADGIPATGQINFRFEVYSLGKPIDRVDLSGFRYQCLAQAWQGFSLQIL